MCAVFESLRVCKKYHERICKTLYALQSCYIIIIPHTHAILASRCNFYVKIHFNFRGKFNLFIFCFLPIVILHILLLTYTLISNFVCFSFVGAFFRCSSKSAKHIHNVCTWVNVTRLKMFKWRTVQNQIKRSRCWRWAKLPCEWQQKEWDEKKPLICSY